MDEVEQCFVQMEVVSTTPTNRLNNQNSFISFTHNTKVKKMESFSDYLDIVQKTQGDISTKSEEKFEKGFSINFEKSGESFEEVKKDCLEPDVAEADKIDSKRNDVLLKSSLRFVRNQLRDLFKYHNKNIVKSRYVNCKTKEIFKHLRETLSYLLPEECISDYLVYYCIGIFKLKDYRKISCPASVKKEVQTFLKCIKNFSKDRFYDAMSTENCRSLCHYLINSAPNDERTKVLKQFCE